MAAVRRFEAGDAPAVTAIIRGPPDYFTDDVPAKAERDAGDHEAWVIADSGTVTGFAITARKSPAGAEILWMAVEAGWRGRGHGTTLLVHVDTIDQLPDWEPGNPAAIYVAALRATR